MASSGSQLRFSALHPTFGAEVLGLDLQQSIDEAMVSRIDNAMDQYGVLLVRGPILTQDEQMRFTKALGPLDLGFRRVKTAPGGDTGHRFDYAELADISNVTPDEKIASRDSRKVVSNIANQMWHADSSFQCPRAKYSLLHAVTLPGSGGDTQFADQRNAWDRLNPGMQEQIRELQVEHFALHSRFMLGDSAYTQAQIDAIAPVLWPLVQTHAGSQRKHLFIGAHARAIQGMVTAEARMLLWDLLEHTSHPDFIYTHQWQPGDLVIWDNRCMLHRGRSFDLSSRRELRRSTTLDPESALLGKTMAPVASAA
ncbi:MAG: TauD/TfdA family dioxygenase [Burkholderiaceae bacterium]